MKALLALALPLGLMAVPFFGNLDLAPQDFDQNTFVDFKSAHYEINFDVETQKANFKATVQFDQLTEGRPIFDLVEEPLSVQLDGKMVSATEISDPDKETRLRALSESALPGQHEMVITGEIKKNLKFSSESVNSAFWMSDLSDRRYLEQYLPTNFEFDQYKMSMTVKVLNASSDHELFANGSIKNLGRNEFAVDYPNYFTTSSLFFHLTEKDDFKKEAFSFKSISGQKIPVVAYSRTTWSLWGIEKKIKDVLNELEEKFGAWSHPSLTVYIAGSGGMEYSGATMTSLYALGHEITHSYFARGVMPVNGNSGWLDEAIASWRDDGYQSHETLRYSSAKMSGFSEYKRTTDRKAYDEGAKFMAYLNAQLVSQGGLQSFLREIYSKYVHKNITTELFRSELEAFSGQDFKSDFKGHVYGGSAKKSRSNGEENPFHPRLSEQELLDLL